MLYIGLHIGLNRRSYKGVDRRYSLFFCDESKFESYANICFLIPHASRIPTSPQRATFMENEYGWFMCVYGMSFVSSEILKPEPRKHKKIKAQSSEVGTNYRPK